ncbi:MAG: carboxypeptidase-like regulatory domain-containing protein [Saprospiraceae bacterium]
MKCFFTTMLIIGTAYASQSQVIISGNVKDELSQPIVYGSVSLLNASDSTLVRGSLTDLDGNYTIENVSHGSYIILASYLGYENVYSSLIALKADSKRATVDIQLVNKGVLLQETVITAKKPFLEQKSDRLVVNVANSAVAAGGTAMDIIKKVPGVVVTENKVTMGVQSKSPNLGRWKTFTIY